MFVGLIGVMFICPSIPSPSRPADDIAQRDKPSKALKAEAERGPAARRSESFESQVAYKIADVETIPGIKRSVEIELPAKITQKQLESLAAKIKQLDSGSYDRTFIGYYLPGMIKDAGYWATTHYNPTLEVKVLGLSLEDEKSILAKPDPPGRSIIGKWTNEGAFAGVIVVFEENGKLFLEQVFGDGSSTLNRVTKRNRDGNLCLVKVEDSDDSAGFWSVNPDGVLEIRDSEGMHGVGLRLSPWTPYQSLLAVTENPESNVTASGNESSPGENARTVTKRSNEVLGAIKVRKDLCGLLEELLEFKDSDEFKKFGFATGGPYNVWLEEVEALRDAAPNSSDEEFPVELRTVPSELLLVGIEYLTGSGETEYTRQSLPQLKEALDYESYLAGDPIERVRGLLRRRRTWRDNTGKFSVEAKLVEFTGDHVVLEKKDGSTTEVAVERLSEKDKELLEKAYGSGDQAK